MPPAKKNQVPARAKNASKRKREPSEEFEGDESQNVNDSEATTTIRKRERRPPRTFLLDAILAAGGPVLAAEKPKAVETEKAKPKNKRQKKEEPKKKETEKVEPKNKRQKKEELKKKEVALNINRSSTKEPGKAKKGSEKSESNKESGKKDAAVSKKGGGKPKKKEEEFEMGSLVFVKDRGCFFWPARIDYIKDVERNDKSTETRYMLMYFGTHEVGEHRGKASMHLYTEESLKLYQNPPNKNDESMYRDALYEMEYTCTVQPWDEVGLPSKPGPSSGLMRTKHVAARGEDEPDDDSDEEFQWPFELNVEMWHRYHEFSMD